jgi:chemotaxis protein histidine kinase CheA/CheY-like chemotaxis protein
MQSEQQQRIMGYFIEEAKDHLNTIEQGLLNLKETIEDSEMVNEVFRAAHSVKGGAAMLGLSSIQHTAHRLEDYFKILRECPVQIDQALETLFLKVFDALQELLEQLQGPFGLTDEKSAEVMANVEPVFQQLNRQFSSLVGQSSLPEDVDLGVVSSVNAAPIASPSPAATTEESALQLIFQSDVPVRLREMLQVFKQEDNAASRQQLQDICMALKQYGEQFDLAAWCGLLENVRKAIASPANSYRALAPVVIKEVKQAQELILSRRAAEITASEGLKALLPAEADEFGADFADLLGSMEFGDSDEDVTLSSFDQLMATDQPEAIEVAPDLALNDDWFSGASSEEPEPAVLDSDLSLNFGDVARPEPDLSLDFGDVANPEPDLSLDLDFGEPAAAPDASLDLDFGESVAAPDAGLDLNFDQPEASDANLDLAFDQPVTHDADLGLDLDLDAPVSAAPELNLDLLDEPISGIDDRNGPEVGIAELNSLADLFEGEMPDLGLTWQEEEIISDVKEPAGASEPQSQSDNELSDLLFDPEQSDDLVLEDLEEEDLSGLLNNSAPQTAQSAASADDFFLDDLPDIPAVSSDNEFDLDLLDEPAASSDELGLDLMDEPAASSDELGLDLMDEPVSSSDGLDLDLMGEPAELAAEVSVSDDPFNLSVDEPASEDLLGMDLLDESASSLLEAADDPFGMSLGKSVALPEALEMAIAVPSDDPFGLAIEESTPADDPFGLELETSSSTADPFSMDLLDETPGETEAFVNSGDPFSLDLLDETPGETEVMFERAIEQPKSDDLDFGLTTEASDSTADDSALPFDLSSNESISAFGEDLDGSNLFETADESLQPVEIELDLLASEEVSESVQAASEFDSFLASENTGELIETEASEFNSLLASENVDKQAGEDLEFGDLWNSEPAIAAETPDLESASLSLEPEADAFFSETEELTLDGSEQDLFAEESDPLHNGEPAGIDVDALFADEPDSEGLAVESPFEESSLLEESPLEENLFADDFVAPVAVQSGDELDMSLDFDLGETEPAAIELEQDVEAGLDFDLGEAIADDSILDLHESPDFSFDLEELPSESIAASIEQPAKLELPDSISAFSLPEEVAIVEETADLEFDLGSVEAEESEAVNFVDMSDAEPSGFSSLEALLENDIPNAEAAADPFALDFSDSFELEPPVSVAAARPEVPPAPPADEFSDLEAMLDETPAPAATGAMQDSDTFDDLDALLSEDAPPIAPPPVPVAPPAPVVSAIPVSSQPKTDEFGDLEDLLKDADQALGGGSGNRKATSAPNRRSNRRGVLTDQTMRVSVKHLDNLNNLVGEMVVNRNSLEQAQERLRQFLDNLLYQVQQLSDVGQRMRDLYERSLLESSLLSSRRSYQLTSSVGNADSSHATGESFDALEMDRFTGFHTLSQEMIELIVRVRESASDIDFVVEESDQVTRNFRQITTQLQEGLTRARMVPFAQTADRLPRGVRDNALKYGKQAELQVEGRETLIDKMIVEQLYDPMTHLVNNAVAHGIETPEERTAAGKSAGGKIILRTFHQGNQTIISVSDDGAGIDPERVKSKAIAKGLITAAEAKEMSRMDTYDLLFHHGFSTADQIDDLKGRGVGLDVVRSNLNEIRGVISIDSSIGKGTTFTIRLPLTLSISKALCCISNRARIAFPMDGVEDMLDVPKERVQTDAQGRPCIYWRDALLPFQPLSDLLKHGRMLGRGSVYGGNQEDDIISVVVLRSGGDNLALQVDQVLGEQEIVIKQLEGPVPKPIGVAGATVLGDGRIMPIADVLELIDLSEGRIRRDAGNSLWEIDEQPEVFVEKMEPTVLIVDDSITVRELLSMTFNKVGYRVEQARDGQEAWEKLRSGLPCDLVFCDIEMPRMDGLELLSRIQKDSGLNHLPIAMLTSRGADRHRQMAVQLGAKGYFTKPYLEEALLDAAQRMLKGEVLVTGASAAAASS